MDAIDVVVCLRAIDKAAKISTDSVIKQCIHCRCDVWVSPECAAAVKEGRFPDNYECMTCFETGAMGEHEGHKRRVFKEVKDGN